MTTVLGIERMPVAPDALPEVPSGTSSPLGATPLPDGTNFSVYSKHADGVDSLLHGIHVEL